MIAIGCDHAAVALKETVIKFLLDNGYEVKDFGIYEKTEEIDSLIGKHSNGWRPDRMSRLSRSVLRMCVYEMLYEDVPHTVSINEAIEICKKFDDDKARPFINGILNSVKQELEAK